MADKKKILVSGIQPSGKLHLGNYFGALKQFIALQDQYESYISIVNYHALTTIHNSEKLRRNTLDAAIDHIAAGLDPQKVALFVQSSIPEVAELAWIFETLVTVPYFSRAHAYKDKVAKGIEPTVGLFNYPALMAADILIHNADVVPVGADQKQHIEYARDIAEKFNTTFGKAFTLPKALIQKETAVVPGTDGQKMSKSYGNIIPLFATRDEIEKAVMSIPTDSQPVKTPKNPDDDIVFQLHTLFPNDDLSEIRKGYEEGGLSYADSKKILIDKIDAFIQPLRKKRREVANDKQSVVTTLADGAERAREHASGVIKTVREKTGLSI